MTITEVFGEGVDTLSGIENITGSAYADMITGDADANVLTGGAGNDTVNGGAGFDTASYIGSLLAVTVDLQNGTASGGDAQGDTLVSIENLTGSDVSTERDRLYGDAGVNHLQGMDGKEAARARTFSMVARAGIP